MSTADLDRQIIREAKHLAKKECAGYSEGQCLECDSPCHVIHPVYRTIHDGAINCDWFIRAVLPLQPDLHTAYWHEIFREAGAAGAGWKECLRCRKPFIPGSNRQQYCKNCGAAISRASNRERQRRYRQSWKSGVNVTL